MLVLFSICLVFMVIQFSSVFKEDEKEQIVSAEDKQEIMVESLAMKEDYFTFDDRISFLEQPYIVYNYPESMFLTSGWDGYQEIVDDSVMYNGKEKIYHITILCNPWKEAVYDLEKASLQLKEAVVVEDENLIGLISQEYPLKEDVVMVNGNEMIHFSGALYSDELEVYDAYAIGYCMIVDNLPILLVGRVIDEGGLLVDAETGVISKELIHRIDQLEEYINAMATTFRLEEPIANNLSIATIK